jgi:hypothetical protein
LNFLGSALAIADKPLSAGGAMTIRWWGNECLI